MGKAKEVKKEIKEKRCLIVESDEKAESEYREYLIHMDFSVKSTKSHHEALKILKKWVPHVILVHFRKDESRSIDLIKEIYKKDPTASTIYITGHDKIEIFVKAMKAGSFWALDKPSVPIKFEIIVERAFEESILKRDLFLSKFYVFVLMPFDKKFDQIYQLGIKEPLNEKGLVCERADEAQIVGGIMEQVYNKIKKARFIVADITGGNSNVCYEVGYAHAIGKDVILLRQKKGKKPFDLIGYSHIEYRTENILDLREKLLKKVGSLLSVSRSV